MQKKTEKEKMLAGELYDAEDEELVADRERAKKLCQKFNNLATDDYEARTEVLKELFQIDHECYIEPTFYCDYGYNINLGENFMANHNCVILDVNTVTIGDNVMFGPNVQVYTATHPVQAEKRNEGREMGYEIEIGDNVWIGGSAVINAGVTIGDNTVIGSGSVVTKDIPANVLAAGNPCRVIKEL